MSEPTLAADQIKLLYRLFRKRVTGHLFHDLKGQRHVLRSGVERRHRLGR